MSAAWGRRVWPGACCARCRGLGCGGRRGARPRRDGPASAGDDCCGAGAGGVGVRIGKCGSEGWRPESLRPEEDFPADAVWPCRERSSLAFTVVMVAVHPPMHQRARGDEQPRCDARPVFAVLDQQHCCHQPDHASQRPVGRRPGFRRRRRGVGDFVAFGRLESVVLAHGSLLVRVQGRRRTAPGGGREQQLGGGASRWARAFSRHQACRPARALRHQRGLSVFAFMDLFWRWGADRSMARALRSRHVRRCRQGWAGCTDSTV